MKHKVTFTIPPRELGRSDAEFAIAENDDLLGTLKVSKGSVVWFPKHAREGHKIAWADFSKIMIANAKTTECR